MYIHVQMTAINGTVYFYHCISLSTQYCPDLGSCVENIGAWTYRHMHTHDCIYVQMASITMAHYVLSVDKINLHSVILIEE